MWGTSPDPAHAGLVAVAEPRNRQERFAALEVLGTAIDAYLAPLSPRVTMPRLSRGQVVGTVDVCADAPQIVVPNAATAAWLFGVVGRFTRYLRVDGDDPVPATVPRTGQNLTFFGQQSQMPGSCVALAATDLLTEHWATEQLDGKKQNLASLLGWIDPPDGFDGQRAAADAERDQPPAGPQSDPNWDARELEGLIAIYHAAVGDPRARTRAGDQITEAVRAQLAPGWADAWRALAVVRRLPEAAHVPQRWDRDKAAWARHVARIEQGDARFRVVPSPLQAARSLGLAEKLGEELASQMALDDPAVMARSIARGDAVSGVVIRVDRDNREPGPTGRRTRRPLVDLRADIPFEHPVGTTLHLTAAPGVCAELADADEDRQVLRFRVVAGALTTTTAGRLPSPGARVVLSSHGPAARYPDTLPPEIPWTHRLPEPPEGDL